jgi:hypothetical protein
MNGLSLTKKAGPQAWFLDVVQSTSDYTLQPFVIMKVTGFLVSVRNASGASPTPSPFRFPDSNNMRVYENWLFPKTEFGNSAIVAGFRKGHLLKTWR